jgi:hypothetical protein
MTSLQGPEGQDEPVAPDASRLVFVAGLHRSGTTPLARILGQHPQVSTFRDTGVKEDEGQHLQTVYPPARSYGGAGLFAFDPRSHLTESSPLCSPENARRLLEQWARHWDLTRPVLVEKSPPNLVMTRFLSALFPGCRIVVCVRHPVVVALSTSKWSRPGTRLERLVDHWLAAHDHLRADAVGADNIHLLRYEHLVTDPRSALDGVARFLRLTSPLPADGVDPGRSDTYLAAWQALRSSRAPWNRRTVRALSERAPRIAEYGYDMDDLSGFRERPLLTGQELT